MTALQRDNDDDNDDGGGGDIAARWPCCQLLLSKLLFISCLNVEIYVVTLIIEIHQKGLPLINMRLYRISGGSAGGGGWRTWRVII